MSYYNLLYPFFQLSKPPLAFLPFQNQIIHNRLGANKYPMPNFVIVRGSSGVYCDRFVQFEKGIK